MNKKGFTLIELMAVIAILSIILVIAVPKVIDIISDSKQNLYNSTIKEIESTAAKYVSANPDVITDTLPFTIELQTLCDEEYLTCPISSPIDNTNIEGHITVNTNSSGKYIYTFVTD